MVLIGSISWVRGVLLFTTQIIGGIVAAALTRALLPGKLNVSTELNPTMSLAQGTILEMILTAQLVFTIFMLAAEKHTGTFIAPVGIGLSLFIGELVGKSAPKPSVFMTPHSPICTVMQSSSRAWLYLPDSSLINLIGVFWTGGSLNPARSFGPSVVTHSFVGYHWIYWVGPLAGTILAVLLFNLMKALEYESANPDPETGDIQAAQNGQVQSGVPGPRGQPGTGGNPNYSPNGRPRTPEMRHGSPKPEDMV